MLRPDTAPPTLPADTQSLEVLAPDVVIPGQETTYWCFIQQLPENMPKNHIVMVAAIPAVKYPSISSCLQLEIYFTRRRPIIRRP